MKTAFQKDILRTLRAEKKRILALMVISALGVTMMTGLKAACDDLRVSGDRFFDAQNLQDLEIVSTLGLTDDDLTAIRGAEGVSGAEGQYSETVQADTAGGSGSAIVKTFTADGISVPYVTAGRLPEAADEIAVTENYLTDAGLSIGDVLTIHEDLEEDEDEEDADDADAADADDTDGDGEDGGDFDDLSDFEGLDDGETPNFPNTQFVITGTVIDPSRIINPSGTTAFRNNGAEDYVFFVTPDAVDSDVYTAVLVTVEGAKELSAFTDEYDERVAAVEGLISESILEERQQARYDEVIGEGTDTLTDAQQKMEDAFADADAEIADAEQELADGRKELADGEQELADKTEEANKQIYDGWTELLEGFDQLDEAERQLAEGQAELNKNRKTLQEGLAQIEAGEAQLQQGREALAEQKDAAFAQLDAAESEISANLAAAQGTQSALAAQADGVQAQLGDAFPSAEWNALRQSAASAQAAALAQGGTQADASAYGAEYAALAALAGDDAAALCAGLGMADGSVSYLTAAQSTLAQQRAEADAQFAAAEAELDANAQTLAENRAAAEAGLAQIDAAQETIDANRALLAEKRAEAEQARNELSDAQAQADAQLADARQELADGKAELADGEQELADSIAEYREKRAEAEEKLADGWRELSELDGCTWYTRTRGDQGGYSSMESDADCIESIGTVFPVLFLLVAVLISLTTITRMVEEERGLIGTYQALGFSGGEILCKYAALSLTASLAGGLLGNLFGYVILPEILFIIFKTMYSLPVFGITYNAPFGLAGIALFVAAILGATVLTCRDELRRMPAALMRPKAPRGGSRILLERVPFLWKRLSFLNKVTLRNLFRYKKRMLMTVFGIAGCSALLLCGFSIKDTVADLMPKQYDNIIRYDVLAATAGGSKNDDMLEWLSGQSGIEHQLNLQVTTATVRSESGESISVQLYVLPDGAEISDYFTLKDTDGNAVSVTDAGIAVTENAGIVLGFGAGGTVTLQTTDLREAQASVTALLENYLGNSVFVTRAFYEQNFTEYDPNAVLLCLEDGTDEAAFTEALDAQSCVLTVTGTQELRDSFDAAFLLMNLVVYVVIVLAAALAFVVLFTLSTTNISERERELATIKVLGFYDGEVHRYVNKETLLLTLLGILCGIPVGNALSNFLGMVLKLPAIIYRASIHPVSYAISAAMAFAFALAVNRITDRVLNRIDPVEALKSVE